MERVEQGGHPPHYRFASLTSDRVIQAIFTRLGGVSEPPYDALNVGASVGDAPEAVSVNNGRVLAAVGARPEQAITVRQVHGAHVAKVCATDAAGTIADADGLATACPGLVLLMRFADCVPVLFYAPDRTVVAIAHAGWRGTLQGIAVRTAALLRDAFGCDPGALRVGIGPSIGPCCYEVGADVYGPILDRFGTDSGVVAPQHAPGKARVDLWRANLIQLQHFGIHQVEMAEMCTHCRREEFFSHRGDHGRTGRFAALIGLRPMDTVE